MQKRRAVEISVQFHAGQFHIISKVVTRNRLSWITAEDYVRRAFANSRSEVEEIIARHQAEGESYIANLNWAKQRNNSLFQKFN